MSKPPLLSGREIISALKRAGYIQVGQKGSHIKPVHPEKKIILIVPDHQEVDRWTLKNILQAVEISMQEVMELLQ